MIYHEVMPRNKMQINFYIPVPLIRAFRQVMKRYGEKGGWAGASAGMLLMLQLDESERSRLVGEMVTMDTLGTLSDAINAAMDRRKPTPPGASQTAGEVGFVESDGDVPPKKKHRRQE